MVIRRTRQDIKLKYLKKRNRSLTEHIEKLKLEQADIQVEIAKLKGKGP